MVLVSAEGLIYGVAAAERTIVSRFSLPDAPNIRTWLEQAEPLVLHGYIADWLRPDERERLQQAGVIVEDAAGWTLADPTMLRKNYQGYITARDGRCAYCDSEDHTDLVSAYVVPPAYWRAQGGRAFLGPWLFNVVAAHRSCAPDPDSQEVPASLPSHHPRQPATMIVRTPLARIIGKGRMERFMNHVAADWDDIATAMDGGYVHIHMNHLRSFLIFWYDDYRVTVSLHGFENNFVHWTYDPKIFHPIFRDGAVREVVLRNSGLSRRDAVHLLQRSWTNAKRHHRLPIEVMEGWVASNPYDLFIQDGLCVNARSGRIKELQASA